MSGKSKNGKLPEGFDPSKLPKDGKLPEGSGPSENVDTPEQEQNS